MSEPTTVAVADEGTNVENGGDDVATAEVKAMSAAERKSPGVKYAGPQGSFPIRPGHPDDVKNAWDLAGHADNPDEVRASIQRIAGELGMSDALPGTAKGKKSAGKAWPSDETLVYYGGAVKALGGGRIGGVVVPFGSPDEPDPQGDFFTPQSDIGLDITSRARLIYHHGFTKAFGSRKLGVVEYGPGDSGFEVTAGSLDTSDPDVRALYVKAEEGKLFFSSGSTERLVVRRPIRPGVNEIVSWPIVEISLTPTPVDRRARAFAVKAIISAADAGLGYDDCGRDASAACSALQSLSSSLISAVCMLMCDDETPNNERIAQIRAEFADFDADGLAVVMALIDGDSDAAKAVLSLTNTHHEVKAAAAPSLAEFSDRLVADATELKGLLDKALDQRRADNRHLSAPKRDAIKAVADAFAGLHRASLPKPSREAIRSMRIRAMRALMP